MTTTPIAVDPGEAFTARGTLSNVGCSVINMGEPIVHVHAASGVLQEPIPIDIPPGTSLLPGQSTRFSYRVYSSAPGVAEISMSASFEVHGSDPSGFWGGAASNRAIVFVGPCDEADISLELGLVEGSRRRVPVGGSIAFETRLFNHGCAELRRPELYLHLFPTMADFRLVRTDGGVIAIALRPGDDVRSRTELVATAPGHGLFQPGVMLELAPGHGGEPYPFHAEGLPEGVEVYERQLIHLPFSLNASP